MSRSLRSVLAGLALCWLAVMYGVGELPRHGHFNDARNDGGVFDLPPEAVMKLELVHSGRRFEARRKGAEWEFQPPPRTPLQLQGQIEAALRYLRVSPPVRSLGHPVPTDPVLAASGLVPAKAALVITTGTGKPRRFSLGGVAPDGILRYLRDDDSGELHLVSGFVANVWDDVAKAWKSVPPQAYKR